VNAPEPHYRQNENFAGLSQKSLCKHNSRQRRLPEASTVVSNSPNTILGASSTSGPDAELQQPPLRLTISFLLDWLDSGTASNEMHGKPFSSSGTFDFTFGMEETLGTASTVTAQTIFVVPNSLCSKTLLVGKLPLELPSFWSLLNLDDRKLEDWSSPSEKRPDTLP
jgi:hypothetical protein